MKKVVMPAIASVRMLGLRFRAMHSWFVAVEDLIEADRGASL